MALIASTSSRLASLRLPAGRALVAVSGGVDSVVLLDLLVRIREVHHLDLVIAHVDHGMQPADAPAAIVQRLAEQHHLPLHTTQLHLGAAASETAARAARLGWLRQLAAKHSAVAIFLGHHADDQAETVLMRLLRGSGPAGLAGMAVRRGLLVRPLLDVRHAALVDYGRQHALAWWEDPANEDPRHLRSWIRRDLLPPIRERLPDVTERLRQASEHAARDRQAWRAALNHWPALARRRDGAIESVGWAALLPLPPTLRTSLVQALLRDAGCGAGPRRIAQALRELAGAQSGASADLADGWRLELAFDRLRLRPPESPAATPATSLTDETGALEWGAWSLHWTTEQAPSRQERAGPIAWFTPQALSVRTWQPGDRVALLGGRGHRQAVRCFQDARVPLSDRAGWPVLEGLGGVAWIPGVCRSSLLVPLAGAASLRVEVRLRG